MREVEQDSADSRIPFPPVGRDNERVHGMSKLMIEGGRRLHGDVPVHGAKNGALPILAAAILADSESVIQNCPNLSDVDAAIAILTYLGCRVTRENNTVAIDPTSISQSDIPDELMREMRSSIVFLGAIVSKLGQATLSFPGGCELGPRPIDLHLSALRQLGLDIKEQHGILECKVNGRLRGAQIALSFPSVGATENIILAAVKAQGDTILTNAAREPEIADLAAYLNACGAKIYGAGEGTIRICGVDSLHGVQHRVIPDRIVAATYMAIAAITQGEVNVLDINPSHLSSVIPTFEEAGCSIKKYTNALSLRLNHRPRSVKMVRTMPYPGFPTDAQSPLMALMTVADKTSVFVENIFESRYKHVSELLRLGANIKVEGRMAVIEGVEKLSGAPVQSTDLRGGAALVIAGLAAEGVTEISGLNHIDRGYENITENLNALGAAIRRE